MTLPITESKAALIKDLEYYNIDVDEYTINDYLCCYHFYSDLNAYNTYYNQSLSIGGMLHVRNAGSVQVNGVYNCTSKFNGVDLYSTKSGIWNGDQVTFTLFRCRLSDSTKRWYISIIPPNNTPGTSKDIDFYMTTAHGGMTEVPHGYTWQTVKGRGSDPPPAVEWQHDSGLTSDDNGDPVEGGIIEESD